MDWQSKADLALAELQESYESPVYNKLLAWVHCQYEAEKEAIVMASNETIVEHMAKVKCLKEFKNLLLEKELHELDND